MVITIQLNNYIHLNLAKNYLSHNEADYPEQSCSILRILILDFNVVLMQISSYRGLTSLMEP